MSEIKYTVSFNNGLMDSKSTLLYEGTDQKLAELFIPRCYRQGGMNGGPEYLLKITRVDKDGDEYFEGIRFVYQESFLEEKWLKRLLSPDSEEIKMLEEMERRSMERLKNRMTEWINSFERA